MQMGGGDCNKEGRRVVEETRREVTFEDWYAATMIEYGGDCYAMSLRAWNWQQAVIAEQDAEIDKLHAKIDEIYKQIVIDDDDDDDMLDEVDE